MGDVFERRLDVDRLGHELHGAVSAAARPEAGGPGAQALVEA